MKNITRPIIIISAIILRNAMYVSTVTKRRDGKYQVELTNNLRDAKDWDSLEEANRVKDNISNPFERKYVVEETLVDWPKAKYLIPGKLQ
jgi:hypothetical protein